MFDFLFAKKRRHYADRMGDLIDSPEKDSNFRQSVDSILADISLKSSHTSSENRDYIQKLFEKYFQDHKLSQAERESLLHRCRVLNLPENTVSNLVSERFTRVLNESEEDRRLTPEEEERINETATALGLDEESAQSILGPYRARLELFKLLYEVEQGNLPATEAPFGFAKKKRETVHLIIENTAFHEERTQTTYQGGSQGLSFRVAKGVNYRVGGHKGHIERTPVVTHIDDGKLIITSERIVFIGERKRKICEFKRFIDFELFSDGIKIAVTNRQKPSWFIFHEAYSELMGLIVTRLLNDALE